MRILIADDAGFIRQIIRDAYVEAGHEIVAESSNGPDTILYALEQKPDLAIIDIVLPELNGLEAMTEIKQQCPEIILVATSSLTTDWIENEAKKTGCIYFLRKPFTKEELLRVLEMAHLQKGREIKHG